MHSVVLARRTYTVRIQRAQCLNNPTNVQRVASVRNEWPVHAALDMHYKHAGCVLRVR